MLSADGHLVVTLPKRSPNVVACFVDVAPFAIPSHDLGQTVMEIFGLGQISGLDDDLPSLVHVSPLASNLDGLLHVLRPRLCYRTNSASGAATFSSRRALNALYTNDPRYQPSMYLYGVSPVV